MMSGSSPRRGFTLIELMVAVAVLAILAAVAMPSYKDYVLRGKLVDGPNALAAMRARMEQYYQDNRTYVGGPCASASTAGVFTVGCRTVTATAYNVTATGSGLASDFTYTIDQNGNEATTSLPSDWGGVPAGGYACWVTRRGASC